MKRILVIGCGNPYRGDDGIGFRVAEQYEAFNKDHGTVQVMAVQELKPELVETLAHADSVVFVNAAISGEPGTVWSREIVSESHCNGLFSQDLTPCALLGASKFIYHRCPDAFLITVTGENFGFSSHLSPQVEAALPKVFARIQEILNGAKDREAYVTPLQKALTEDW